MNLIRYCAELDVSRTVLWCYLIWYLVTLWYYFDPSPELWLNVGGITLVVGFALKLGVSGFGNWGRAPWQTFRLFATPFCVASFSMLTVNRGYRVFVPPDAGILVVSLAACACFLAVVAAARLMHR